MTDTLGIVTTAGLPADAALPADPPAEDDGEAGSPARQLLRAAVAQTPFDVHAGALRAGMYPTGVDLYENNAWFQDQTVNFMILKAFEYRADSKFAARFPAVAGSGRLRGAYLFGHPSLPPSVQAGEFVKVLKDAGFGAGDRPWLDHEVTDGKSPSFCSGWAQEACDATDAGLGLAPGTTGVYTYTDFIRQGNCAGLGHRPLWFALPSPLGAFPGGLSLGPWSKPALVQYVVTSIDWDYYLGSAQDLNAFWKAGTAPVPPKPPAPPVTSWTETLMSELPTLQAGSTDAADVKSVQGLLDARGFKVTVDGVFGPVTRSAVMALQHQKGITADGICGPATWRKLLLR